MVIGQFTIVSMRYIMRNSAGDILENTIEANPVNYLHGGKSIDQSLQAQIEGLKEGDRKTIFLSPGSSDNFSFEIIIDSVNKATEEEIMLGYPVNRNTVRCEDDCDCYSNLKIQ